MGSIRTVERRHQAAYRLAATVAAWGLPTARVGNPPTEIHLGGAPEWGEFLALCEAHRLLGLLADAVRAGAVQLDDRQIEQFELRYTYWLTNGLVAESALLRALAVLREAGIEARVLKGVALAHTLYRDPSSRVFADADVLVESGRFAEAVSLLMGSLGAPRLVPELRPGFDGRFGREVTLQVGTVELDLHRTLVDGPFGLWIPLDDLLEDPAPFTLGRAVVFGLGPAQRFVHACLSAVLGDWPPRLVVLRDLAGMMGGGSGPEGVDVDAVRVVAQRWRATAVVARAVRQAVEDLGLDDGHPLASWARAHRPTIRERVLIGAYRGPARGYTSQALSVLAIRGWRERWWYVRSIVRPSREYLEARGFRRGDRVRRALGIGSRATGR